METDNRIPRVGEGTPVRMWTNPFTGERYINIRDLKEFLTNMAEDADNHDVNHVVGYTIRLVRDRF